MQKNFKNDSVTEAVSSVYECLDDYLRESGIELSLAKIDTLLKIHGLSFDDFDYIRNVESLFSEKLNDVSIDDNSNKNGKTIRGIMAETTASTSKIIGYRYLYRKLVEKFGKKEAKRLSGALYSFDLGLSDSTNILIPYCWSLDTTKVLLIGRDFGQLKSKPAKRISSYISAVCETVHQGSSLLAGAIALPTLFLDSAKLLMDNEGSYVCEKLQRDKKFRKFIENEYQQLIWSLNSLSRAASESPFSNVSVLDKPKISNLVSEYEWLFVKKDGSKYDLDDARMAIEELQKVFLDVFNQGQPDTGAPIRFPVVTLNITKDEKTGEVVDKDFLEFVTQDLEIFRYNIFASGETKMASCCRMLNDNELTKYASQSNSFGAGGSVSLGSHRVVTINLPRLTVCDNEEGFESNLVSKVIDSAKILSAHKALMYDIQEKDVNVLMKKKWITLDRMFSTIGIIGINEMAESLVEQFGRDKDYWTTKCLDIIESMIGDLGKDNGILINIEQIPGESFARRLPQADSIIYGDNLPKPIRGQKLYSNQFIPLWEKASIWKKIETEGKYLDKMTGGGIAHINVSGNILPKDAEEIIMHAVKSGCEHFALNTVFTEFEDKTTLFGKFDSHPQTNSPANEHYTRIVGFHVPVSSWNEVRREWEFPKRFINQVGE